MPQATDATAASADVTAAMQSYDPSTAARRGWPAKALAFNPSLRGTAGLRDLYAELQAPQQQGASPSSASHETLPNGSLCLSPAMPLLAHRYRYMHTLSQSDLSQVVCAIDTFQHCEPTFDGRRQPLVALKILNAQHWAIGAQEYERIRLVWREQSRHGTCAQIARALSHCEVGAHFCIVWEMLRPLWSIGSGPLPPPAAAEAAGAAGGQRHDAARAPPPGAAAVVTVVNGSHAAVQHSAAGSEARTQRLPLPLLRQLAYEVLGALLVLREQGVLHADIKPDNIMAETRAGACGGGGGFGGAWFGGATATRFKLIDFSNAMSVAESAAYHDAFDVQTLSYRAPEVIFGEPFDFAIDMWSLGTTLAELFCGRALVQAAARGGLAVQVAQLLGRPPQRLFARSKYAAELLPLVQHTPDTLSRPLLRRKLALELGAAASQPEHQMLDLIAAMLDYDPATRLTPQQALAHPLFADAFPLRALRPEPPAAAEHAERAERAESSSGAPGCAPGGPRAGGEQPAAGEAPSPPAHTPRLGKRGAEPGGSASAELQAGPGHGSGQHPKRQAVRGGAGPGGGGSRHEGTGRPG